MGLLTIDDIGIVGISSVVPQKSVKTVNDPIFANEAEALKFQKNTGVKNRNVVSSNTCTSDLGFIAAKNLIEKLNWDTQDIDILVLVTQTADFISPNSSIILQDKLGLKKSTIAFDLTLGCSGFVYGLSIVMSLMKNFIHSKAILVVGDTLSRQASPFDKSTFPLFGDGVSAIALEDVKGSKIEFNLFSDGSGYNSIIVPGGMYRNPYNIDSLNYTIDENGISRNQLNTKMDGTDVFSFAIQEVPKSIESLIEFSKIVNDISEIDCNIFHQANYFILETIRMKLKIDKLKFYYSIDEYGNTSSASIPITISHCFQSDSQIAKGTTFLFSGFGVGLSLGSAILYNACDIQIEPISFYHD